MASHGRAAHAHMATPHAALRGACWFCILRPLVALTLRMVLPAACLAGSDSGTVASQHVEPTDSLNWDEVDRAEVRGVLEMLAGQTRGSFERLRTWRGEYAVETRQHLSAAQSASLLQAHVEKEVTSPHVQVLHFTLQFAIDIASDSIYRWKIPTKLEWGDEESGGQFQVAALYSSNERSAVTPEHYLHFEPNETYSEFRDLPSHPALEGRRAAFRDPPEAAEDEHWGDHMDPRLFYGCAGTEHWVSLELYVEALSRLDGVEREKILDRVGVRRASDGKAVLYRTDFQLTAPDGSTDVQRLIWSSEQGFYPVEYSLSKGGVGQRPLSHTVWRYERVDGICVPAYLKERRFHLRTGALTYEREAELRKCVVNEPIDPSQFSYVGLGIEDGDLVMDRIDRICYIFRGGKLVKAAHFGEGVLPGVDSPSHVESSTFRWGTVVSGLVFLGAVLLLVWRRRRKIQQG